jgi:hypothetical protein
MKKSKFVDRILTLLGFLSVVLIAIGWQDIGGPYSTSGYIHLTLGIVLLSGCSFGLWKLSTFEE